MKRLLLLAALLIPSASQSFAQNIPGVPGWVNGYINTWADLLGGPWTSSIATQVCQGGQYYWVTYRIYSSGPLAGTQIPIQSTPTGEPCDCNQSGGSLRPHLTAAPSPLLHPKPSPKESNCTSDNGEGQQVTVPGQEAAGSTGGYGGSSSFAPTIGPAPQQAGLRPMFGRGAFHDATQLTAHAAAAGSTFTFTLPFRDLPSGPLVSEVVSPVNWVCNASLNPTMFRVFHVTDVVSRVNMCNGQAVADINVPDLPLQVRVTPDGSQAIVTSFSGAITFINTSTNMISGSIQPADENFAPDGIAISPDGSYALVTNYLNPPYSYLAVVDIATKQITGKIPLNTEAPESVFINPDGTLAWVTHPWDNTVEVVDILSGTIVQNLAVTEPFSVAFNPTGTRAFVSSGAASVEVFDTSANQLIKTLPADYGAMDLEITPDGRYVYVNNSLAQSMTVIDAQFLNATTTNLGGMPQGSVLVPSE